MIGAINWISKQTRPDIAFDACLLSANLKHPTVEHLLWANQVVRRIINNDYGLLIDFGNADSEHIRIEIYVDASFGNLRDGGSQGAYLIFLTDGVSRCLVSWQSKKIRRIVKSTLAAETLALIEGAESGLLLQKVLSDSFGLSTTIECFTDNASLVECADSDNVIIDKRLRIDMGVVRQMILDREISIKWVATHQQLANCLTKKNASSENLLQNLHLFV